MRDCGSESFVRARLVFPVVLIALLLSGGGTGLRGQTVTAPAVKAGFLYNFAKFAEWPSDVLPPGAPLVLCVIEDVGVTAALEETATRRTVEGHPVVVRKVEADGPVRTCHLLYVDRPDPKTASALIARLSGASVLSVGGQDGFAQLGGVAHLFVDNDRMRFAVNVEAAQRQRVKLSSRLLSLAVIVKDSCNVTRP